MDPAKISRQTNHSMHGSSLEVRLNRRLFIGKGIYTSQSKPEDFSGDLLKIASHLLDSRLRVYEVIPFAAGADQTLLLKSHDSSTENFEAIFELLKQKLEESYKVTVVDNAHG